MAYVEPKVEILEVSQNRDVTRIVARFDKAVSDPVAPSGLYINPKSGSERFQLHKLISQDELVFTFETYHSAHPLPMMGDMYSYRGWWLPKAIEAVLDEEAQWQREQYPNNGNHDHCLLTWETIASYSQTSEGYHSEHGWITVDAYNKFIRDDIYHLKK
jgi:hypothetical protein